jgi:hypothetical protein
MGSFRLTWGFKHILTVVSLWCCINDKQTILDEQVAVVLMKEITDAFELFAKEMLTKMKINPKLASLPIEVCMLRTTLTLCR